MASVLNKKTTIFLLICFLMCISVSCRGAGRETMAPEELEHLKAVYPEYFDLDTSKGINVLVCDDLNGEWIIRLVSGEKECFSLTESVWITRHQHILTLEEAKKILLYYNLPDEEVFLRPYNDFFSPYGWQTFDDEFASRIASAFDHRYQVGSEFLQQYDPETDGIAP